MGGNLQTKLAELEGKVDGVKASSSALQTEIRRGCNLMLDDIRGKFKERMLNFNDTLEGRFRCAFAALSVRFRRALGTL